MKICDPVRHVSPAHRVRAFFMAFLCIVTITVIPFTSSLAQDGSSGDDVITNTGTVTDINGLDGGDTITNTGIVNRDIYGSQNTAPGSSSGSSNIMNNSGRVYREIYGSFNLGLNSSGGNNTITNNGSVDMIIFRAAPTWAITAAAVVILSITLEL